MPLAPLIEFLAAQRGESGEALTTFQITEVDVSIPPNASTTFLYLPVVPNFMVYGFLLLLDPSVVPGAIELEISQAGFLPFSMILHSGALGRDQDSFLRITRANPGVNRLVNRTNLMQRIIYCYYSLSVASEADYIELERRLAIHVKAATHQSEIHELLKKIEENTRPAGVIQPGAIQPGDSYYTRIRGQ